jgi:hypothetical protein
MNERDGYQSGVPCWVGAAPPEPGGAAFAVSELVVASRGA